MSENGTRIVVCERCRAAKTHHARGCCKACYSRIVDGRDQYHAYQRYIDSLPCPACGGDRLRPDFTGSGRCHAGGVAP